MHDIVGVLVLQVGLQVVVGRQVCASAVVIVVVAAIVVVMTATVVSKLAVTLTTAALVIGRVRLGPIVASVIVAELIARSVCGDVSAKVSSSQKT